MFTSKGSALPLVIIVMLVLVLLGTTILSISLAEAKQVAYQDNSIQAYYIARSAADALSRHIIKNPVNALTVASNTDVDNKATGSFANGTFSIDVINDDGVGKKLMIESTGIFNNQTRSVSVEMLQLDPSAIFRRAVFSNSDLDITGMKVNGEVESGGTIQYSESGSNKYTGDAYPNSDEYYPPPVFPTLTVSATPNVTVKKETKILPTGYAYNTINVEQNSTLTLSTDNTVKKVLVNTLIVDNILDIIANSGGRIELYVENLMRITTKGYINNNNSDKLVIFMAPGSKLEMQSGKVFNGYIYGPQATVLVQSDHTTINGAVIANVVVKNDNGNGPNGTVNYRKISDTINISDSIKAYTITEWDD